MKDVHNFVKLLFVSGQTDLARQQQTADDSEDNTDSRRLQVVPINSYKVNVQANAAFVDLLVWVSADEAGAYGLQFSSEISLTANSY